MKVLIVESPTKAKTITKYLDDSFEVISSVGHIRDLPKSDKGAIDIEGGFIPKYIIPDNKVQVIRNIKRSIQNADDVLIATDPDREGEAIAWHIAEVADIKKPKRIIFHEITKEAVLQAVQNPHSINNKLKVAQEARRVLDRLFGYTLSKLIWKKVRYGLSAGRVQSPALRILMEKEREIRAFISHTYYTITAEFKYKNSTYTTECVKEITDKKERDTILKKGKEGVWKVYDIKKTEVKRSPYAPFKTSTLQQTANSRLSLSPAQTMRLAQKLYEAGHITYMRTDSVNMSAQAYASIKKEIEKEYGKEYYAHNIYKTKSKNAQEAHEAIRPSVLSKKICGATESEKKLYTLIRARTLASQMVPALSLRTKIICRTEGIPDFSVNGSIIKKEGWLKADVGARSQDVELPDIEKGAVLELQSIQAEEKETTPPPRYSEAGLVRELEKRDIGRPSTYASIIKTLVDRQYVTKEGRTLIPTDTGEVVSNFLESNFKNYISDTFTAHLEDELDNIAEGKAEYTKTLQEFYTPFLKEVDAKEHIDKLTVLGKDNTHKCPVCKSGMVMRLSKQGIFLSCDTFPECKGARTRQGEEIKEELTGEKCPKCDKGDLVKKRGKFGVFIGCNTYPKCKFIKEEEEQVKKNKTGVKCNKCKKGELIQRNGKFGPFFGCDNYPDCKHTINSRPTGALCPFCKSLMMEGTKTIPERCSDKTCKNNRPDRLAKEKSK